MRPPRKLLLCLLFAAMTLSSLSSAEARTFRLMEEVNSGVYNPTTGSWNWLGISMAGGTAVGSYLLYRLGDPSAGNQSQALFGRYGTAINSIGNYLPLSVPVGYFLASRFYDADDSTRARLVEVASELTESMAFSLATTMTLRYSVNRTRPDGFGGLSFPSLPSSLAFAVAGTLAYESTPAVSVPALMAASILSLSQYDSNGHFASDLLTSAGIGAFFATAVHCYHEISNSSDHVERNPVLPLLAQNTFGLSWFTSF